MIRRAINWARNLVSPPPPPADPLQGERLPDVAALPTVNFHRVTCCDEANRAVVQAARANDFDFLKRHLAAQDVGVTTLFDDEYFDNRPGLQRILAEIGAAPRRVVEVGCGNCELLKRLQALGHEVVGVDSSEVRILRNRPSIRELHFGIAEDLPVPDRSADVVVATELLEHVFDLARSLAEIHRVLRPGGSLHCQVPLGTYADGTNHVRHFLPETLRYVLEARRLKVQTLETLPYLQGGPAHNLYAIATRED